MDATGYSCTYSVLSFHRKVENTSFVHSERSRAEAFQRGIE